MKKSFKSIIYTIILLSVLLILSATVTAAKDDTPPITILVGQDDGYSYEIEPYKSNNSYYFLLPGALDPENVTVKYNGTLLLCDEKGEPTLYRGDTLVTDASSGTIKVSEYNTDKNSYTKYTVNVLFGGDIGSVYVTLDDGDKALKQIHASKSNERPGDIIVIDKAGNLVFDGPMSKMTGHGFTSFIASATTELKNSYNFNIETKSELLYGAGDAKKWVLLAPRRNAGDRDLTGLSQIAAFETYSAIIGNKRASIEGEYIDLYINGDYRGLYILTERMNDGGAIDVKGLEDYVTPSGNLTTRRDYQNTGRDPALNTGLHKYTYDQGAKLTDSSVDITGGYVLEVMHGDYEGCGFETKNGLNFTIKSPEVCTKEMVRYIAAYVQNFENAIYSPTGYNSEGKHYSEYVDMRSLADMVLVYSYFINFEYFRTSTYIYKDADGESNDLLTFGPAWDFETGADFLNSDKTLFGTTNGFVYNDLQQYIWSEQLWQHGDFMDYLVSENERMKDALSELTGISPTTTVPSLSSIADAASLSADMNALRWGGINLNKQFGKFIDAVDTRYSLWYDTLWNPEKYMLSVDIDGKENDDGTITFTASVNGNNKGDFRWYKIYKDDPTRSKVFSTQKDNSITIEADGSMIYCTVSGANNAYYEYASGEIFSSKNIRMKSANVVAEAGVFVEEETTDTEPTTDEVPGEDDGCSSSASPAIIFTVMIASLTAIRTSKNKKSHKIKE